MNIVLFFEKYGFLFILLFCLGWFTPNLTPKLAMMDTNAMDSLTRISGANITKQLFWLSIFVFFLWRFFSHKILTKDNALYLFFVLALCSIAMISIIWSQAPSTTLKRTIFQFMFGFSTIMALYYANHHNSLLTTLRIAAIMIIGMTIVSIIMGVAFSSRGELAGFANNKNVLAQNLLAFLVLFIVYINITKLQWQDHKYLLSTLVLLLLLTISKTSITLFFVFLLLATIHIKYLKLIATTSFIFLFLFLVTIPSISHFLSTPFHIGQLVDSSFFTGRGIIWDTLYYDMEYFSKFHFGYGYGAYFGTGTIPWFFDDDWSFLKHIASSHNGYIDLLLQFGFWGTTLLFVYLLYIGAKFKLNWFYAGLMVIIIYNFTESAFFRDQTMIWFLFISLLAMNSTVQSSFLKRKEAV